LFVKNNIEFVKRIKLALEKETEDKKLRETESRKKKENQMSQFEVNKTCAVQLKHKLEEIAKTSGRKLSLNIETIQIFSLINFPSFPTKKSDIPNCIDLLDK